MKYNTWKKIAIVLMVFVGLFIVLAIVPGFVALVTTPHIINVDTNSQWISFWGNYLGAITGGVLSGGVAIYVMTSTFRNSKKDQRRQNTLDFMRYLAEKNSETVTNLENMLYSGRRYIMSKSQENHQPQKNSSEKETQGDTVEIIDSFKMLNQFLSSKNFAKSSCYNLYIQLNAQRDDFIYASEKLNVLCNIYKTLIGDLETYWKIAGNAKSSTDETFTEYEMKIVNYTNELADLVISVLIEVSKGIK